LTLGFHVQKAKISSKTLRYDNFANRSQFCILYFEWIVVIQCVKASINKIEGNHLQAIFKIFFKNLRNQILVSTQIINKRYEVNCIPIHIHLYFYICKLYPYPHLYPYPCLIVVISISIYCWMF